jgi:hypothetical protein
MSLKTDPPARKWRDVLPIHPSAELFPLMPADELRALGEDIKKQRKLTENIVVWSPGTLGDQDAPEYLLDGRNRLDAMELVGLQTVKDGKLWPVPDPKNNHRKFIDHRWEFTPVYTLTFGRRSRPRQKLERDVDPHAYVISANIQRRHLTAEQKRELIAKLVKATPEKSNRQIAETVKASPTTVGTVRANMEAKGEVSKLDTRTDAKGVKQPATKPTRARGPTHVCWQCRRRGEIGEVKQHHYPAYYDADVWLHDACIAAFAEKEQREGATAPAHDDIGPASTSGIDRKDAEIEELRNAKRRLEIEAEGLRSEIEEAKATAKRDDEPATLHCSFCCKGAKPRRMHPVCLCADCFAVATDALKDRTPALQADDGLDIPASLRRSAT